MKFTVSFDLIEKSFQFILAFWVVCSILVTVPDCEILAVPLVTVPPLGAALAITAEPKNAETTKDIFHLLRFENVI